MIIIWRLNRLNASVFNKKHKNTQQKARLSITRVLTGCKEAVEIVLDVVVCGSRGE